MVTCINVCDGLIGVPTVDQGPVNLRRRRTTCSPPRKNVVLIVVGVAVVRVAVVHELCDARKGIRDLGSAAGAQRQVHVPVLEDVRAEGRLDRSNELPENDQAEVKRH